MNVRMALRALVLAGIFGCLSACTAPMKRTDTAAPESTVAATALPVKAAPAAGAIIVTPAVAADDASPWHRMRGRFGMPGCEYSADVLTQATRYARHPHAFTAAWKDAMPILLLVLDEIEKRGLPAEFALLPFVESNYVSVPANGNGPAGIWQLMPRTARERGIRIDRDYDGRLDLVASTQAALDLIERLERELGDWRLATMAFNAGEYRVKRALTATPGTALDANALSRLKVTTTTHEHLTRMLALAYLIDDPARFDASLPDPEVDDRLGIVAVDGPIDLRVAANLAGLPLEDMKRFNAAHLGERSAVGAPARLLLPRERIDTFAASMRTTPLAVHTRWRSMRIDREAPLEEIARKVEFDAGALAIANRVDRSALLPGGSMLLVPDVTVAARVEPDHVRKTHMVTAGDTLSAIARRYGVRISQLLNWNSLRVDGVLRPGARLRVGTP